jgi:hypothetical protein
LKNQETLKKIIKKLKLSHKNEKKLQFLQKEKKIFKPYNWNEVLKKSQSNFGFQMGFNFGYLQCHKGVAPI